MFMHDLCLYMLFNISLLQIESVSVTSSLVIHAFCIDVCIMYLAIVIISNMTCI